MCFSRKIIKHSVSKKNSGNVCGKKQKKIKSYKHFINNFKKLIYFFIIFFEEKKLMFYRKCGYFVANFLICLMFFPEKATNRA